MKQTRIPIRNRTKKGFLWAYDGDGIDISTRMKYHRGTVQRCMALTINTHCDCGVAEVNKKEELCNKLIENNLVEEGDMIYHSYSSNRLEGKRPINTTQNKDRNVSAALTTRPDTLGITVKDEAIRLGGIYDTETERKQAGGIWDKDGISPNIDTMQGGNRQPLITDDEWFATAMRGRGEDNSQTIETSERQEANAITTAQKDSMVTNSMRIRKLTPRECWRLMGWDDESFSRAEQVNSNSQLYKQAGNGIVVNCFAAIIKNLL